MAQVLSQDEVDALLKGLSVGKIKAESGHGPVGAVPYDFANPERTVRERMPTLEIVHDRFARVFRTTVSNTLRRAVDVSVVNSETRSFGEFLRGLPAPASVHAFKMHPLKGSAIVAIEGRLAFALVESFFGGRGGSSFKLEGRDFTAIESRILRNVVEMALADYQESWRPTYGVSIEYGAPEVNPQFISAVPSPDLAAIVECELELEDAGGRLIFCLPYSLLEPIKDRLAKGFQSAGAGGDANWTEAFEKQLRGAPVEVRAVLGTGTILSRELLDLQPGDIITLDQDQNHPLSVFVENRLKLTGRAGSHQGNRAIQVIGRAPQERN
jgi:flagellar motor switch protein FliM